MLEVQGYIDESGKLTIYRNIDLKDWIKDHSGKDVVLSIKQKRKKRSNPQNAYYWGVVVDMVRKGLNDLGHEFSQEETHEFLKSRFNSIDIASTEGEQMKVPQSTTKLNTIEFMTYIENIQRFGAEYLSVVIPSPNEALEIDFPTHVITAQYDEQVNATIITK